MDKKELKRHDLVFISKEGKDKIWNELSRRYSEDAIQLVTDIFKGNNDIPGFARRSEKRDDAEAVGFVHYRRINGNRLRIPAFVDDQDIVMIMTPYEIMQRKAFTVEESSESSECIKTVIELYVLATSMDLHVGILGSAALELATGLPYTDEASDIDLLIKPAPYDKLLEFYRTAKENFSGINMDFELDLPNGYGVKLAEVFMNTQTLLGKSMDDVNLLPRKEVIKYLV
ncbi:MAG: phosphoribosyl-dephospho-CoA transferase MdcG domain-containing protein [Phascolarctobacterium sp.]